MRPSTPSTSRFHFSLVALVALASFAGLAACEPVPPDCQQTWGSTAKSATPLTTAPIITARAGRNDCFDRFVVEVNGAPAPGWNVRYVDQATQPGSGHVVALRGGARIQSTINAPAYNLAGQTTYQPANSNEAVSVVGFTTLRQVAYLGSFEGYSDFGLGVRARLPFRAFILPGPGGHNRLVIDVAHAWP
ncbi:MAG: hypothetical protein ABIP03_00425 [Aquihabitans sp.]